MECLVTCFYELVPEKMNASVFCAYILLCKCSAFMKSKSFWCFVKMYLILFLLSLAFSSSFM